MTRDAYRFSREPEGSEMDTWDRAVARLLGPVITESDRVRRCADALALAAAALRAAGADDLATQAQQRNAV